jgi:hypothetical protein
VERGFAGGDAPAEPPALPVGDKGCAGLAQELRRRIALRLPNTADLVAVHVSSAEVEGGGQRREVVFTRVLVGPDPRLPAWSRTFLGHPGEGDPPWLEPLARELDALRLPWRGASPPDAAVVLDAFAAADLVRAAALGWLRREVPSGTRVLPPGFDLDDPGSPFGGDAVDDEGTAMRPFPAVRDGVLLALPRALADERAGRGAACGSAIAPSWRAAPVPTWRSIVVGARRSAPPRPELAAITRVVLLPGEVVAFGHVPGGGRFGPWPAGAPEDLLAAAHAACGEPVIDAVGVPLVVPPLIADLADWQRSAAAW